MDEYPKILKFKDSGLILGCLPYYGWGYKLLCLMDMMFSNKIKACLFNFLLYVFREDSFFNTYFSTIFDLFKINLNKDLKITIANLKRGQRALIKEITSDIIPLKLLEMGCLPGNEVQLLQTAPFQCPMYLTINGSHLAIRKDIASQIEIEII